MPWPQPTDYNAAVQNPAVCFADPDLRQGQVVGDLLGLPRPHSGNFADVYQVRDSSGQSWAVKCFTREVHGLQERYQAISEHLSQSQRGFMVDFRFLEQGVRIGGQWFPVVKMRWVEGLRLNEFVAQQVTRSAPLEQLARMWLKLARELREADMAHGDLQHGNVLLVPGAKATSLLLRLIDYDGLYVPALADRPSGEVGHPNYQHPQRLGERTYNAEIDRFTHLVIYTALRCLDAGGKSLWELHDNGENLLFREEDFSNPAGSPLLRDLWALSDDDARNLAGHLVLACRASVAQAPLLDDLVTGTSVRPLTAGEQERIEAMLGPSPALEGRAEKKSAGSLRSQGSGVRGQGSGKRAGAGPEKRARDKQGTGLGAWIMAHPWVIPWLGLMLTLVLLLQFLPLTSFLNRWGRTDAPVEQPGAAPERPADKGPTPSIPPGQAPGNVPK